MIPEITPEQFLALRAAIEAIAPEQPESNYDEYTPSSILIEVMKSGAGYHDPMHKLMWRGYTADQIREIMDQSVDKGSDRWNQRYKEIEGQWKSTQRKKQREITEAFGTPWIPPPGCIPHWDPNAPVPVIPPEPVVPGETPEERKERQKKEAKDIGDGKYKVDLRPTILDLDGAVEDLVYAQSSQCVVHLPTMRAWKKTVAKDVFAASIDTHMDVNTQQIKPIKVFDTWLEDRRRKSVDLITWSPAHDVYCEAPEREMGGQSAVNTWTGWPARKIPDDWDKRIDPFLEHVNYLIPDPSDAHEFIQWLAHIIQRPGELPHRYYLMVAEAQGVGRNWLTTGVCPRLFSGHCAVDVSLDELLSPGGFNGQLSQKVLATVDEVREGVEGGKRHQRAQKLKGMITTPVRSIDEKYGAQSRQYNCVRWIMLSNHLDAVPIDNTDRRCVVIFNPAQPKGEDYYEWIYGSIRDWRFINSVWQYLSEYDISDFNAQKPAKMTEAKKAVVDAVSDPLVKALGVVREDFPGDLIDKDTLTSMVQDEMDHKAAFHAGRWAKAIKEAGFTQRSAKVQLVSGGKRVWIYSTRGMDVKSLDGLDVAEIRSQVANGKAKTAFG